MMNSAIDKQILGFLAKGADIEMFIGILNVRQHKAVADAQAEQVAAYTPQIRRLMEMLASEKKRVEKAEAERDQWKEQSLRWQQALVGKAPSLAQLAGGQVPEGYLMTPKNGMYAYYPHPAPFDLSSCGTVMKLYATPQPAPVAGPADSATIISELLEVVEARLSGGRLTLNAEARRRVNAARAARAAIPTQPAISTSTNVL